MAAALTDRYNHIDALILSAVHSPQLQPLGQTYPAVLQETFTINVVAQTSLIGACLPLLKAACHLPSSKKDDHAPTVVFVTDTPPEAYWGAYAASKKAMESIMGSYAQELAHTRIRFITVNPGPIATDMREKSYPGGPKGAAPHEAATAIVEKVWGPIQP